MKEIELKKLRKRREKHFLQEDGTIIAKVYGEDIHFKKGNEYKEIDNTLVKENEYYTNNKNEYKVYFKENSSDSLMKVEENNHFLEISLLDTNNVPIIKKENISKLTDSVVYEDVLNGIDLEYKVLPTKVKENIIIKNKNSVPNKLCFSVKTNLQLEVHNKIILAKDNQKIIFRLDAPYMIDSNNNYNKEIYYNLIKLVEGYKLELVLDEKWLENATYPVVIDPTITNEGQNNSVNDVYIYPGDTGVDINSKDILKVGVERVNNDDIINRTLIKFDLPTIATGDQIISAYFTLVGYATEPQSYESDIVNVHRITVDWDETSANWETMNDKFDSRVEASFDSLRSYTETFEVIGQSYLYPMLNGGDITSLVKKWYSGLENYGIMLKENKEVYRNDIIPAFYSKNNTINGDNPKPVLVISYRNQNGLESYMDYKKQEFSNGDAYINSYNGNLTTIFDLGKTIGGKLPANLSLVYNTNDVILNNDVGLGKGYKLNYQQTIKESDIENYLEYLDEDGTIHYFKFINEVYKDEDGLSMTIEAFDNQYILRDKNNNEMLFVKNNKIGYLTEIKDVRANKILINYNSNNLITKIVDANLNEISLTYENDKITIISPEKTTILNISNNNIVSIVTATGITYFDYNEKNIINSIIDENGRKISYEYYSQIPHRVKKVSEYGVENTLGCYFNITYNFNSTTMIDEKDRVCTMTFNNKGNLISISNLTSSNDIKNAYGQKYEYDETIDSDYSVNPVKNKLLSVDIPNKYVKNYLNNTSFESNSIDFSTTDTLNMEITNEISEFGLNSLKITNTDTNNCVLQNINVPKGNDYTFSAYIKNSNNVKIALSYIDKNNELVENSSNIINSSEFFERHDVTINYPSDAISELSIKIYLLEVGTTYIDGIQLEEGEVCNNYNMLENSDFSNGLIDWIITAEDSKNFDSLLATDYFEIVNINENNDKALKIKMDPSVISRFEKKYYVNGKAGDIYNISFWYKNEAFPTTGLEGDTIYNDMMIFYNYLDQSEGHGLYGFTFNPNDTDWQYFTQSFMAEKDFDYLSVRFYQGKNANNFYITNMCLFKDVRSVNYEYNELGNMIAVKSLNNTEQQFNYDKNNELIKMMNPKGKNFYVEYDNEKSNVAINGISDLGISNQIKYDQNDNPILTKVQKNINPTLNNGLYRIRLKGTNKYLRYVNNSSCFKTDDCKHDLWYLEVFENYYKIYHSVLLDKYLTISNDAVKLKSFDSDNSLFILSKNKNGSYLIKPKTGDKYLKFNDNSFNIDTLIEGDYQYEFYFETSEGELFIESSAEYTEDGKFLSNTKDSLLNKTIYDVDSTTGLVKSVTNAKSQTKSCNYNDRKQITSVTVGDKLINYKYNDQGLLSEIEQGTRKYLFNYDEFLKTKSIKIGDDINLITNNYENNNGNLISCTYGNNNSINYEYDNFDRVKRIIKMDDIYNYYYDSNGNIAKINSSVNKEKYTYDISKRLSNYKYDDFVINYLYDINNNVVENKYKLNNFESIVENVYSDDDAIIKAKFDSQEINYEYDELGRLISENINGQFNTNYKYLTKGKRTSYLVNSMTNNKVSYTYKYDELNNITHIYNNGVLENKYYYDEYNQLIKEKNYYTQEIINYEYDELGNLLKKKIIDLNNFYLKKEINYQYENDAWRDLLTKFNDSVITYDNIGNPISIGNQTTLSWINGRELFSYNDSNNNIIFKYNRDGVRTSKIVNNIETKYYLEGKNIILEKTNNNMLYYIYNGFDELVGFKYNNILYYYLKNIQNDIIGILNQNYELVASYKYDTWGKIISITDGNGFDVSNQINHIANINPFRYRSYYYDKEMGLYYLNSRYYNPEWSRFINSDILLGANQDILSYNLYAYVSNNPVMNVDTFGFGFFGNLYNKAKKWISDGLDKLDDFISSYVSTGSSTKKTTSTAKRAGIVNEETYYKVKTESNKNAKVKLSTNVSADNYLDTTGSLEVNISNAKVSGEIGLGTLNMSAGYKNKNTTYTLAMGLDKFNLFASFDAEVDINDNESAGATGTIKINIFIPLVIIAVVASSPVAVPAGVAGILAAA